MKTLNASLSRLFKPAAPRRADPHRKAREEAKALAKAHGITIDAYRVDGRLVDLTVYPPRTYTLADPWEGDHAADDWAEALAMVRTYAGQEGGEQ